MDDFSDSSLFLPDNYAYTAPSLPGGWSLSEGLTAAATTAKELFGAYIGAQSMINSVKFAEQSQQLDLLKQTSSIDMARTMTGAQVEIAKLQSQEAINRARYATNASASGYDLTTILGNVNARIAGMGSQNQLMLWLAVAGVGIAALQFFKGRK